MTFTFYTFTFTFTFNELGPRIADVIADIADLAVMILMYKLTLQIPQLLLHPEYDYGVHPPFISYFHLLISPRSELNMPKPPFRVEL
jgi:hypothetical protein